MFQICNRYEYFEYAHKAVQLQAFDFLLKPITTEKLLSVDEEYVNVNIKVLANKKAELLEKINQWLKELN